MESAYAPGMDVPVKPPPQPPRENRSFEAVFRDRAHIRADCNLIRRAIREGWEIPADELASLPSRLGALLDDPGLTVREQRRAAELLLIMAGATSP